jgi:hypothetical protein
MRFNLVFVLKSILSYKNAYMAIFEFTLMRSSWVEFP